jgi:S1-C subfamily serine protease
MRRVVEGFRSPTHEVQHPSIGIFCKDSLAGGALVTRMRDDSPAAKGGMQLNDIILSIDGQRTKTQIAFASVMLQKEVGQTLAVWVLRNSLQVRLTIVVGKA